MINYFDQGHRLDYGSLLYPDEGYELSFAVGCTYSLDFEVLLSVPVYLGAVGQPGTGEIDNPFLILESIRRSSDKIALFCNCDGIRMMRNVKPVFALLENSVFPVSLGPGKNFHPKIWVIRYESKYDSPSIIKIIVLSRNLTFDRSMDLAIEMKGIVRGKIRRQSKQKPVSDMLNYLVDICDVGDKAEKIKAISDDLMRVELFEIDDVFNDYSFKVTGIPGHEQDGKEICSSGRKVMIISPFLSKTVVSNLVKDCSYYRRNNQINRVLITRMNSLTPDVFDLFDEVYVPKDGLEDNSVLQEVDNEPKRDLHAKVIFKDTYYENAIYIGSFNATSNARDRNVEVMVKFSYSPYKASLNHVKEQFVDSSFPAFQRLLSPPIEADDSVSEEMIDFSDVVALFKNGRVQMDDNGSYSIVVDFKSERPDVMILPLFLEGRRSFTSISTTTVFDHMTIQELSELFIVKKDGETRIIKIHLEDLPCEERNDAIISSIIDSKPKLMQFILYLLSDDPEFATLEIGQMTKGDTGDYGSETIITPSIYEKMLLAVARNPEKIVAIKDIISRIGDNKIDQDFIDLVSTFDSFIGE